MIATTLLTAVVAAPAPQIVPSTSDVVLLGSATRSGRLELGAFHLGDGGVRPDPALRGSRPVEVQPRGQLRTPGGVLIEAQTEGVKLTFPSRRELLVTPSGRVHLRGGEHTLPFFGGVRLLLADDAHVTIRRSPTPRRPLASVDVDVGGQNRRIWSAARSVTNASHTAAFRGTTLLALGDGGVLYAAYRAGPVVALERTLCPADDVRRFPTRRVVIAGDVLAASMRKLPDHAPRRSVQFPQVELAARRFAELAPVLFERSVPRPPGAAGELWLPLPGEYRLQLTTSESDRIVIGLYRAGTVVPGVEWTVGSRTEIHFVRPEGGLRGGPRYFLRGIDLREQVETLLPIAESPAQRLRVVEIIANLGGRVPKTLKIRHSGGG